jgi:hypothetical protein
MGFQGVMLPCVFIFYVSALEFVHLRPCHWLNILITYSFSVEIFSMFRQNSVVSGLKCYSSPLAWGYGSAAQHYTCAQGTELDSQHCLDQGKLAGVYCRLVSCLLLGCFHYRSFPSLCTGSHCWLQGALQSIRWAASHLLHFCPRGMKASKTQDDP